MHRDDPRGEVSDFWTKLWVSKSVQGVDEPLE